MSITVQYGDVTFHEAHLRGENRKAVFHGPDYLYTEHNLHLRCLYSPGIGTSPPATRNIGGTNKSFTDADLANLQNQLLPRKRLKVNVDGKGWIDAQAAPTNTSKLPASHGSFDLALGPFAEVSNIHDIIGPRTAWIDISFRFTTRAFGSSGGVGGLRSPLILSNRWTTQTVVNQKYWNSTIIGGEIVFNGQQLASLNTTDAAGKVTSTTGSGLDSTVLAQLPPPDFGYKRENSTITYSEDGLSARYAIVDSQVPFVMIPAGVADAEVTVHIVNQQAGADDITSSAASTIGQIAQSRSFLSRDTPLSKGGAPIKSNASFGSFLGAAGTALQLAGHALTLVDAAHPKMQIVITATVEGSTIQPVDELLQIARVLVWSRFKAVVPDAQTAFQVASININTSARNRTAQYSLVLARSNTKTLWSQVVKAVTKGEVITYFKQEIGQDIESYGQVTNSEKLNTIKVPDQTLMLPATSKQGNKPAPVNGTQHKRGSTNIATPRIASPTPE